VCFRHEIIEPPAVQPLAEGDELLGRGVEQLLAFRGDGVGLVPEDVLGVLSIAS
jgi:hypothetical protein